MSLTIQNSLRADKLHLPVSQFCRACGERFVHGDSIVVLLDNKDRTGFSGKIVPAFKYSRNGVSVSSVNFLRLCPARSFVGCLVCFRKPPLYGVSLHQLCVDIFMAEPGWSEIGSDGHGVQGPTDALKKEKRTSLLNDLWTVASFRKPWTDVLDLYLKDLHILHYGTAVSSRVSSLLGLPGLSRLPTELLLNIWQMSERSPLSQAIRAHELRLEVEKNRSKADLNHSGHVSLADVVSWQRGSGPLHVVDTAQRHSLPPFVKITIDCEGILEIERLAERPPFVSKVPDVVPTRVYAIEDVRKKLAHQKPELDATETASAVESTAVELRYGRLHLAVPEQGVFSIWNCSSPPELKNFRFLALKHPIAVHNLPERDAQLTTCDLSKCAGITFVYSRNEIASVQFHSSIDDGTGNRSSSTMPRIKTGALWVFVPIGPGDSVTGIWLDLIQVNTLVFRLKLAGDVPIGTTTPPGSSMALLAFGNHITLACKVPHLGASLRTIGASGSEDIPRPDPPSELQPLARGESFRELFPQHRSFDRKHRFWSTASMANVDHIRVLSVPAYGICIGLLFYYSNGAIRALGDCNPDKSIVEDFKGPTGICFRMAPYGDQNSHNSDLRDYGVFLRVVSKGSVHTSHEEDDWVCKALGSGTLDFYVSLNFTYGMRVREQ